EQNELPVYAEYVEDYPDSPYAPQIWAIIRARREALAWMRAVDINTPEAYWTYRQRYPHGIYLFDAERRLHRLSAPIGPPAGFVPLEFVGVPPPLRREPVDIVHFGHAPHAFAPPPAALIHRQPAFFARLAPPPAAAGGRILPAPLALPGVPRMTPGPRFSVAPGDAPPPPRPQPPGGVPPRQCASRRRRAGRRTGIRARRTASAGWIPSARIADRHGCAECGAERRAERRSWRAPASAAATARGGQSHAAVRGRQSAATRGREPSAAARGQSSTAAARGRQSSAATARGEPSAASCCGAARAVCGGQEMRGRERKAGLSLVSAGHRAAGP